MADSGYRAVRILAINGRNGIDSPLDPSFRDLALEALNVDRYTGLLGRKRGGATAIAMTGASSSGLISTLIRHIPSDSLANAELWFVANGGSFTFNRMAGGTSFAGVTADDAIASAARALDVASVSFNGKLFLFYGSGVDRAHCYDPSLSSPRVRRVGLAAPGSITVANQGGGAFPASTYYYRVRWLQMDGTRTVRRSEPGTSVSFTPSGAGAGLRYTRPSLPGEGETHWEVEASSDGLVFYRIMGAGGANPAVAVGTSTFDDTTLQTNYPLYPLSALTGTYSLMPSFRYAISDGNRIVGISSFESSEYSSRYYFTPVMGALDAGDDERLVITALQKNYDDVGPKDGDYATGIGGPLGNGIIYIFKNQSIWQLTPTGDNLTPYLHRKITNQVGCISHRSIFIGQDETGNPCLYFWSQNGPWRIGTGGLQYLGRDIEDLTINLDATPPVHGGWHREKRQAWFWVCTSGSTPNEKLVFEARLGTPDAEGRIRRGWFRHTGVSCTARCAVMASNTLGATMSKDLKPYVGSDVTNQLLLKADTADLTDNATAFQAYVKSRPIIQSEDLYPLTGVGNTVLIATPNSGVTIRQTLIGNFGAKALRTADVSLTPVGSETRVIKKIASALQDSLAVEVQLGDASAVASGWALDELILSVTVNESIVE